MRKLLLPTLCFTAIASAGCMPLWVGAGVGAGYFAVQERGAFTAVSDIKIKTHVLDKLTQANYRFLTEVGVDVLESDVLLTGVVDSDADVRRILDEVRKIREIRNIFNELQVGGSYGVQTYSADTWIGTQLKSRMVTTSDVYTINYATQVVRGHVYVMGIARTPSEKERVLHLIRTTKGVRMVHDYIRVARMVKIPNSWEPKTDWEGFVAPQAGAPNPNPVLD